MKPLCSYLIEPTVAYQRYNIFTLVTEYQDGRTLFLRLKHCFIWIKKLTLHYKDEGPIHGQPYDMLLAYYIYCLNITNNIYYLKIKEKKDKHILI